MRIALYSPDVPRRPGGVSDHTLVLARALAAEGADVAVLASRGDPELFAPIPCHVGIRPNRRLVKGVTRTGASWVVLQYVPFLFARHGIAPSLVAGLYAVRRSGTQIAVFVHEPFVPFARLPWLVTGVLQRVQLLALIRLADRVYTAVPAWQRFLRRWTPRATPVHLVPVGATLPPSILSREDARRRMGLESAAVAIGVFSPSASGFLADWVVAAHAASRDTRVRWILFGRGSEALAARLVGGQVSALGELPPSAAADAMRAMDVALAPYVDGLTLRRTAAMLAVAHGVATVSSSGPLFDPQLSALAAIAPDAGAFATEVKRLVEDVEHRREIAARTAGYEELASVRVLARALIADLGERA